MSRDCDNEASNNGGDGKKSGNFSWKYFSILLVMEKYQDRITIQRYFVECILLITFFLGCFKCGEDGHFAKECPNPAKTSENPDDGRPPIYTPTETDEQDLFTMGIDAGENFHILQDQQVKVIYYFFINT